MDETENSTTIPKKSIMNISDCLTNIGRVLYSTVNENEEIIDLTMDETEIEFSRTSSTRRYNSLKVPWKKGRSIRNQQ